MTSTARTTLLALSTLLLSACGPPWSTIRTSGPPSALAHMQTLGVEFDYSEMRMGVFGGPLEDEWLQGQPPGDQASYAEVKAAIEEELLSELRARLAADGIRVSRATGAESHRLIVQFTRLNMGFYRVFMYEDSYLNSRILIGPGGESTDEILIDTNWTASPRYPTILERMRRCATRTAVVTAEYLHFATAPR